MNKRALNKRKKNFVILNRFATLNSFVILSEAKDPLLPANSRSFASLRMTNNEPRDRSYEAKRNFLP